MTLQKLGLLSCALTLSLAATPVLAQQGAAQKKGWQFDVAPYIWAAGVEGTVSTSVGDAVLDQSFGDVLEVLDSGALIHFEGSNGRWGFLVDAIFLRIKEEIELASLAEFGTTVEETIGEAAAFLRFGGDKTSFDLIFGVRGINFDIQSEVTASQFPSLVGSKIEGDRGWADGLLGGRFNMQLSDDWSMSHRIDFASGGSDLTWQLASTVRWQFSGHLALGFGFRVLDVDYEDDGLKFEPQFAGLTAGLGIRFP